MKVEIINYSIVRRIIKLPMVLARSNIISNSRPIPRVHIYEVWTDSVVSVLQTWTYSFNPALILD